MATIITVHGTGATGHEQGDRWWQRGSPFEKHLRELVESEDGKLDFRPHIWDGANRESSRRHAGKLLLSKLSSCEKSQEPYCLIGHSHGGSVIASALLDAAAKRHRLQYLQTWVTVGTPFISLARNRFLFSRVNLYGKAAITSLIAYMAVFPLLIAALWQEIDVMGMRPAQEKFSMSMLLTDHSFLPVIAIAFLFVAIPYTALYGLVAWINRRSMSRYGKGCATRFSGYFVGKWLCVWHRHDEAVCGLSSVKTIKFGIFPPDFAVPLVLRAAIVIVPLLIVYFVAFNTTFAELGNNLLRNIEVAELLAEDKHSSLYKNLTFYMVLAPETNGPALILIGLLVFMPLLAYGVSLIVIVLAYGAGLVISKQLSRVLNGAVWQQLRQRAFGNDTIGETALDAQVAPVGKADIPFLPDELSDEITKLADAAAGKSIAKFRGALSELAFSEQEDDRGRTVAKYLGWDELIHTSYYDVPRLRKLLAYAISNATGFRASPAFKTDPDYPLVAKWFQELQMVKVPMPPATLVSGAGQ